MLLYSQYCHRMWLAFWRSFPFAFLHANENFWWRNAVLIGLRFHWLLQNSCRKQKKVLDLKLGHWVVEKQLELALSAKEQKHSQRFWLSPELQLSCKKKRWKRAKLICFVAILQNWSWEKLRYKEAAVLKFPGYSHAFDGRESKQNPFRNSCCWQNTINISVTRLNLIVY